MIDSPRYHFNLTKIGANQRVKGDEAVHPRDLNGGETFSALFEKQTNDNRKSKTSRRRMKIAFERNFVFRESRKQPGSVNHSIVYFGLNLSNGV